MFFLRDRARKRGGCRPFIENGRGRVERAMTKRSTHHRQTTSAVKGVSKTHASRSSNGSELTANRCFDVFRGRCWLCVAAPVSSRLKG